jgi:hypothetical protein
MKTADKKTGPRARFFLCGDEVRKKIPVLFSGMQDNRGKTR